jgi:CheY-like chemotaxis protein
MPLAEYLRECGYQVFEAAGVAEARAVLDADVPVDLVFTDVNRENGLMLASWIRQYRPKIQVLLTSGIANATEKADLCGSGPLLAKLNLTPLVWSSSGSKLCSSEADKDNNTCSPTMPANNDMRSRVSFCQPISRQLT